MRPIVLLLFCFLLSLPLSGEELLPQVQKELRARKFYFGEIDGRASKETTVAIKRFQLSKGIDFTGHLDGETLRALGFTVTTEQKTAEEREKLDSSSNFILQYLQARESGQWARIAPFFADQVDFYFENGVARDALRTKMAKDKGPASTRQNVLLNCIAAPVAGSDEVAQVTVRVQTRVTADAEGLRTETEDLLFRLRKGKQGWTITALKLLE